MTILRTNAPGPVKTVTTPTLPHPVKASHLGKPRFNNYNIVIHTYIFAYSENSALYIIHTVQINRQSVRESSVPCRRTSYVLLSPTRASLWRARQFHLPEPTISLTKRQQKQHIKTSAGFHCIWTEALTLFMRCQPWLFDSFPRRAAFRAAVHFNYYNRISCLGLIFIGKL